eukprot:scaffold1489_cov194-Cylindrotheca_fusiformis.AAC.3
MFCCGESPFSDAKAEYSKQVSSGAVSSYPGQRRNVAKPAGPLPSAMSPQKGNNSTQPSVDPCLISVTVPEGVLPGQEIHVRRPDGSGSLIEAVVPPGMITGSVFYVRAPLESVRSPNEFHGPPPMEMQEPDSDRNNGFKTTSVLSSATPQAPPGQKLLLVQVTPSMLPSSSIMVKIPDEPGRLVSAQVPPNVNEFYVAYTPQEQQSKNQTTNPATDDKGSTVLPIVGGLASGVAAVMAYDHFAN